MTFQSAKSKQVQWSTFFFALCEVLQFHRENSFDWFPFSNLISTIHKCNGVGFHFLTLNSPQYAWCNLLKLEFCDSIRFSSSKSPLWSFVRVVSIFHFILLTKQPHPLFLNENLRENDLNFSTFPLRGQKFFNLSDGLAHEIEFFSHISNICLPDLLAGFLPYHHKTTQVEFGWALQSPKKVLNKQNMEKINLKSSGTCHFVTMNVPSLLWHLFFMKWNVKKKWVQLTFGSLSALSSLSSLVEPFSLLRTVWGGDCPM